MNYVLIKSGVSDIDRLIKYKKNTIYEYADNLSEEEINKINSYVESNVPKMIDNYSNIVVDGKVVGCVLITLENDGVLLDEIFIEDEFRCLGIGTSIITSIINNNDIVYLWVYKKNCKAIDLYKRLGFKVIKETESRYYMKYEK